MGESLKGTLEGKAAIVTGAARGLGRAMALAFADAGALLALCDREGDELALLAEELRSRGSRVVDVCLDLRDPDAVRAFVEGAGVDPGRLEAVGYGEQTPIDTNKTLEGKARNRRVEFTIIGSDG